MRGGGLFHCSCKMYFQKKFLLVCYRSFGVLLLEIITFADTPLEGIPSEEIVEMAQKSTLNHKQ